MRGGFVPRHALVKSVVARGAIVIYYMALYNLMLKEKE